jgi:gliding motility-associated-like protein
MWQDDNCFTDVSSGKYEINVRDINGCGENSEIVTLLSYSRCFTPNKDEYHNMQNIDELGDQQVAVIYIFDRYVKLLDPNGHAWYGNYNGSPIPSSDYWFTITYRDFNGTRIEKYLKGHFSLQP